MTMHKILHLIAYEDIPYVSRKEEDSPALKIASVHQNVDSKIT